MAKNITDSEFEKEVIESEIPVIVDFWAEWCGPCRQLSPILDDLSNDFKGKCKIIKVNIDDNPIIPQKLSVRSIPTMMMFKNGEVLDSKVGFISKSDIEKWVNSSI